MKKRFWGFEFISIVLAWAILGSFAVVQSFPSEDHKSFGPPLNTQNVEYNPIISPQGHYIVFQSNRPGGQGGMDIWISTNKNFPNKTKFPEWSNPENFKELNSQSFEGMFSILFAKEDDRPNEIYFTSLKSSERSGYNGLNIYYSSRIPDSKNWEEPIHLDEINSNFNDRMPAISPDGRMLVFSSDRPGGLGGFDLWVSFRDIESGRWSEPVNMGPEINSDSNEIAPYFHWDGETIYFSSDRGDLHKKYRFFLSNWKEISYCRNDNMDKRTLPYKSNCWDPVMELGFPFNTNIFQPETSVGAFDRFDPKIPLEDYRRSDNETLSITHDDVWVYFASNRPGGKGQFDIYRSPMPDSMRKSYDFLYHGIVLDGSEEKLIGLDSTIKIMDNSNPIKVITSSRIGGEIKLEPENDRSENFRTILKTGKFYRVEVSSPGFHPKSLLLDLRGNIGRGKSKYEAITLDPIKPDPPKKNLIEFGIYNKKSGETIDNARMKLFTKEMRAGRVVNGEKNKFPIKDYPEEDFEVLVQAEGYKDDTFFFRLEDIPNLTEGETKLYLTNLQDIDKVYSTVIYFPFNVGDISAEDKLKLDKLSEYLIRNPKDIIEIGGHTDNVASKEYNIKLSESRAQSVKDYLRGKGVPEAMMKIKAYYYSQPSEDNSTQEGRAKNRRVNFKKLN